MILDVVYYPDPRLEKVSEPIAGITPEVKKMVKNMFETMYFTNGVGLSAPQVGINKRLLVIDCSGGTDVNQQVALINPVVQEVKGEQRGQEGCLSFPGLFAQVTRPNYVRVKGLNLQGEEIELVGEGLLARALLHEIDHLDGILFIHRMKKGDREAIIRKAKKLEIARKEKVLV